MKEALTSRDKAVKHHVVSVPKNIKKAKVEILTFRGAPAFLGTRLAKLHFGDKSIILYSKMSGVVNRILVENEQMVSCGERLFELRNTNTVRDKSGNKMKPSSLPTPRPSSSIFTSKKNTNENAENVINESRIPSTLKTTLPFIEPYAFIDVPGQEKTSTRHSFYNEHEATLLEQLLQCLNNKHQININKQVGAVTFYKGQVGFLNDFRQLNAAPTRAKHLLIMLGNAKKHVSGNEYLTKLIQDAANRKCLSNTQQVQQEIIKKNNNNFSSNNWTKSNAKHAQKKQLPSASNKHQPCQFFTGVTNSCRKGGQSEITHQSSDTSNLSKKYKL